jgi:hypothetical protein
VPGASLFVAIYEDQIVGAALACQPDDVVNAHLTASDEVGYELGAAYALKWQQMDYYAGRARWLNLAGVPGINDSGGRGLRWFKQGWSPEARMAYFCGRVFDSRTYDALSEATEPLIENCFPAYRAGEFARPCI